MKIVHVMIACFYKEGYGYQENILPVKHKELGNEVAIVAQNSNRVFGPLKDDSSRNSYVNEAGIPVTLLIDNTSWLIHVPILNYMVSRTKGLSDYLKVEKPDIIFVHGSDIPDNLEVVKYKQSHPMVKVFVDQHADYYNSPLSNKVIYLRKRMFGRYIVRHLSQVAEKMWGVTPWRVKYLQEVYGVSPTKTGLLVMGGDENKINWLERESIRKDVRKKYGIPDDAFVVITGGKIDKPKNFHILVEAIRRLKDNNVYLLFFGRFESDMLSFESELNDNNIKNAGWIPSDASYDLFLASDLGCFPGTHSVLWEQACASGLPCIFKDWDGGFNHVDVGGNCILLKEITADNLYRTTLSLLNNQSKYDAMKECAATIGRKEFSYIEIAKRAIGI